MYKKIILPVMALGMFTLLGAGCINKAASPTTSSNNQLLSPSILISDQSLGANNQLVIEKASIEDDGWVVIHTKENGQPGSKIGYTSLLKGSAKTIKVTIDKTNLTPSLIVMLHYDRGEKGVFEFPGADGPVIKDQQVIMKEFNILNYADASKPSSPAKPVGARKEFIITTKQWSFSPAVIKVKKGDTVVLKLKTVDVAHSYSVSEFGINAEIKPGETTVVEFVADKTGTFVSACKIYCGVGHVGMTGTLIVE